MSILTGLAVVIPIHKRGDNNSPDNFRPISLLPIFSKVFERLLKNQILSYFHQNNFFHLVQYGFQKNKSTIDAINHLVDSIYDCFESGRYAASISCDLSKAFDCVPQPPVE